MVVAHNRCTEQLGAGPKARCLALFVFALQVGTGQGEESSCPFPSSPLTKRDQLCLPYYSSKSQLNDALKFLAYVFLHAGGGTSHTPCAHSTHTHFTQEFWRANTVFFVC